MKHYKLSGMNYRVTDNGGIQCRTSSEHDWVASRFESESELIRDGAVLVEADKAAHSPTPWTWKHVPSAGIEILAPVHEMKGVDLPKGIDKPIHTFGFTHPQIVSIAAERWVQFEPVGWHEMQLANAAHIVRCVNAHEDLLEAVAGMPAVKPRQPFDDRKPDGYLVSLRDWSDANAEAVEWFLEHAPTIKVAIAKATT